MTLAARLSNLGLSDSLVKGIIVIGLGALSASLTALAVQGLLPPVILAIAAPLAGAITALAALLDPNADHASG